MITCTRSVIARYPFCPLHPKAKAMPIDIIFILKQSYLLILIHLSVILECILSYIPLCFREHIFGCYLAMGPDTTFKYCAAIEVTKCLFIGSGDSGNTIHS